MHTCGTAYELSVKLSPHSLHREIFNVTVALLVKATVTTGPSELRSCVKVEVAVVGSSSLTSLLVSVDVKQH